MNGNPCFMAIKIFTENLNADAGREYNVNKQKNWQTNIIEISWKQNFIMS